MSKQTSDRISQHTVSAPSSTFTASQSSFETRRPVESIDEHEDNDHFALIYENQAKQFETAIPFIREGLERGERCVYVADDNTVDEVLDAMRARGIDIDTALDSGALSVHTEEETYRRTGEVDCDAMLEFWNETLAEATTDEYTGLRAAAEMTWALEADDTGLDQLCEYEELLNPLYEGEDYTVLCQYNRNRFPTDVLHDVLKTHPFLVYDATTVCQNFYYTPPEEYFGPDQPSRELDRKLATLVDRTDARTALRKQTRDQQELYRIVSQPGSFSEKLRAVFELGCDRFDLEVGYFTRTNDDDTYTVVEAVGDHDLIQPGVTDSLSDTCEELLASPGPTSVADAADAGWTNDPAYDRYGLDAYFATTFQIEREEYGTLCFASKMPREEPYTDAERTLLDLMGQWVQYEFERQRREEYLRNLYRIAADTDRTFEEKLQEVFDLGCERFGLELGGMARIDPTADRFEVEATSADHDQLVPGAQVALSETYCRVLTDTEESAGITEPANSGFEGTKAYDEFGVNAYLGTRIELEGGLDRTFFFVDSEPRDEGFSDADRTFHRLMGQWVQYELEQRQREDRLAGLNTLSRRLMGAETATEVSEQLVEAATGRLNLPVAAVALYDEEEGVLQPIASTADAETVLPLSSLLSVGDGAGWRAFIEGRPRQTLKLAAVTDETVNSSITEIGLFPLANHGLLITSTMAADGFSAKTLEFGETVAANTSAALDRVDRERQLQEREQTLEEQNRALERLNRVNDIIRSIDKALVQASTRDEIEQVVCEQLTSVGPYELAWIGEHDTIADEVTPLEWAGTERGYLDAITITTDDSPEGQGPAGRAVKTREPQVVNNILQDRSFKPWRQDALNRGYHATIALPLVYEDTLYGVLNVYASHPGVFDEMEQTVLTELADTIAYAINAVESKKALISTKVTELEFSVTNDELGFLLVAREAGCDLRLENVVPRTDGGLRAFFTTRGAAASDVRALAPRLPTSSFEVITEQEENDEAVCLFEADLTDDSVVHTMLEHGGVPQTIEVTDGTATVIVELAADADLREFMAMFQTKVPDAELIAQRTHERPQRTVAEASAELTDELTARQLEVFQTAYFSGYFEQPRTRTASEIAATLDISQPTFNAHLRTAQRKLCQALFETSSPQD